MGTGLDDPAISQGTATDEAAVRALLQRLYEAWGDADAYAAAFTADADYVAFDGRTIPYAGPVEHAVTVSGVTPTTVTINDPDFGQYTIARAVFENAYAVYNQMSVIVN